MAVAQLLLNMEPKYICHKLCTMGTSSPKVPILSTEIFPIPAITKSYGEVPLKELTTKWFCYIRIPEQTVDKIFAATILRTNLRNSKLLNESL